MLFVFENTAFVIVDFKTVYFLLISRNTQLNNRANVVGTAVPVHAIKRIVAWRYRSIHS